MKKMFLICLFCMVFTLSACGDDVENNSDPDDPTKEVDNKDGSSTGESIDSVKDTLVSAGYSLEQRNADGMAYFEENIINEPYGLAVTVTDLYVGYLDGGSWIELVELSTESEAIAYSLALSNAGEGHLIYQTGRVVFYTFAEETYALFE